MGNQQSSNTAIRNNIIIDTACEVHGIPRDFAEEAVKIIMEKTDGKEIDPDDVYRFSLCAETGEIIRKVYVEISERGVPSIKIVNRDEYPYPHLKDDEVRSDKKGKKGKKTRKNKK